jgi:hypothetical protein
MKKTQLVLKKIESLRDIRFRDFQRFREYLDLADGNESALSYKILNIFYGITKEVADRLTVEQFDLLTSDLITVLQSEPDFSNVLEMNGIKYGFVPVFEDIKAGELIDLDALLVTNDFVSIMSILYRPIIGDINKDGQYRIEEYKGYDDRFKDISAYEVNGMMNFFMKSFLALNQSILISTEVEKRMNLKETKE